MFSAQLHYKIKSLVSSLQKKNYSQTLAEINTTLEMYHENDRVAVISSLLDDIDFRGEPKPKDEQKCQLLIEEIVNCLKKNNCATQLCASFEGGSRQKLIMQNQKLPDEFLINVCSTLKLRTSVAVSLAFCLCKSQVRSFVIDALKIIRVKLPELNNNNVISEMNEDIVIGLVQLSRSQEDLAMPEISGAFLQVIKANYTAYGSVLGSASRKNLGNNDGFDRDLGQIQKHSENSRQKMSIASILEEYGSHCANTPEIFRKALFTIGLKLDEEQVAAIIIMILPRSVQVDHEEKKDQWNLEVVAEVLNVECRGLNWNNVVKFLDSPNLVIRCEADYQILTRLFVRISGASFPVLGLLSSCWNNRPAYLAILTLAANSPRNIMDFSSLVSPEQLMSGDIATPANLSWLCLPLYARFFDLAAGGMPNEVLDILSKAAGSYPEYFLVSLAQVQDPTSGVRSELLRRLLPSFTGLQGSRPTSLTVMKKLHSANPDLLILLCRFALKKAKKVWEIANIDNLLRSLGQMVRRLEEEGTVDELLGYWCYRADRSELNLEEKAIFLLEQNPKNARVFVSFAKMHAEMLRPRGMNSEGILSFECFAVLLRSVQAFPTIVSIDEVRQLAAIFSQHQQNVQIQQQQQHHQQQQMFNNMQAGGGGGHDNDSYGGGGGDTNELTRMPPGPDSEEIEALANSYFQKIYTSEIAINDVIVLLRQFKSSTEKREQEIFRCMIHNLFDEYRFFHKYPEKELQVTGRLFGALVQHQLVSSITLGIALRYVLEALRKDPEQGEGNDKMFRFGRVSLEQFRSRLSEWPQYCSHLIQIPHLVRHCPDLFQEAQKALSTPQQIQQQQAQQAAQQAAVAQQQAQQQQQLPPPPQMTAMSDHSGNAGLYGSSQLSQLSSSDLSGLPGLTHNFSGMNLSSVENNPIYSQSYMPSMQNAFVSDPGTPQTGSLGGGGPTHRSIPSLSAAVGGLSAAAAVALTMSPPPSNDTSAGGFGASQQESIVLSATNDADKPPRPNEIARMAAVNGDVLNTIMPPESVRDQIHFIINNIAKTNIEAKTVEIKEILKPDHFNWFANYLVVKRISTQPNLHPLYLSVLDALDMNALVKLVLDSAYHNVTKLLQSPNITTSSSERSLLRNLGVWLGQMTLARNKPLLQKRINLKELLFWGFETGRLIAVCSFVAKIVEGVKESKVFRPPNPWLMAILGIMRELYEIEDLKLNIKFEVQVLCKNINIKIDDIPKGTELMTRCRMPVKDARNPDFNFSKSSAASTAGGTSSASPVTVQPVPSPMMMPMSLPSPQVAAGVPPAVEDEDTKPSGERPLADLIQMAINTLPNAVIINSTLQYFVSNPNQRRLVLVAVERGIREIIQAAVERSVTIAVNTTKGLILKDFATEPSEQNLRSGAHFMVSSLAASLATSTGKEPLRISIGNHLRTLLAQSISDQTMIEQIVQVCSNDNVEVGIVLIEKIAVEKAAQDIDEVLMPSYQARRKAREMNQQFADAAVLQTGSKYPGELSEALKPRLGGLLPAHLQVYEGFNRAKAAAAAAAAAAGVAQSPSVTGIAAGASIDSKSLPPPSALPALTMTQGLEACNHLLARIDTSLKNEQARTQGRDVSLSMLGGDHEIMAILREMVLTIQRVHVTLRIETAVIFAEIAFSRMFDSITSSDSLRLEVFVSILEALRDTCGATKFTPDLIAWLSKYAGLVNNDETNRKLFRFVLILMLRAKLLRAADVDVYFVMYIDSGRNLFWLELALSFIRQCLVENLSTIYEFSNTFETVTKMRPTNMVLKKQLQKWLTDIKTLTAAQEEQKLVSPAATAAIATPIAAAGVNAPAAPVDPRDAAVREHVTILLDRWLRVWNSVNDQVFAQYLQLMHQYGVLKTEDAADRFFRLATEICTEACLKTATVTPGTNDIPTVNYSVIDALSKLFLLLVRLADKEASDMNVRVNLLSRILNAVARTLIEDHEAKKANKQAFDQRPFFRLFSNLSQDLGVADPKQDPNPAIFGLLTAYTQVYLALNPATVPGFAYGWVQLISRRSFMPHLLLAKGQKGWPYMHRLLSALLLFLQPFLKASQLLEPIKKLYKGTLRVLLVLLHDFPEFLCDFHLSFCDLIPMNCVQLRNLILSAFPRSMRLPDPFTPNLKLDSLPECSQSPRILTDYLAPINGIRAHLDTFMATRQPAELPSKLPTILQNASGVYNVPLITSLVVYVGSVAIQQSQNKAAILANCMEIYKQLSQALDAEGRYIVFNTMANQMRYPNSHTAFFSNVLLTLFNEAENEYLQEQITRVLLERLIVHRPHPWGLLITFIELIKNPKYAFWKKGFTRSAPEIEKVFESIARSCIGQNAATIIQQQLDA